MKLSEFLYLKIFQFLDVKFSIYLNRRVIVALLGLFFLPFCIVNVKNKIVHA